MLDETKTDQGADEEAALELDDPLLAAAAELFNQRSFRDVTVEAAAKRAKVDVDEARRRFPSSAYLARGIYEAVLDKIPAQISADQPSATDLHDRLCAIVNAEIQMLKPYKVFVGRSILELVNPLSMQLLLQIPTMQRLLAYVSEQIAVARSAGAVGWWVHPNLAAATFGALHAKIITYWLTLDDTDKGTKTLAVIERDIRSFVGLLQNPLGGLRLSPVLQPSPPVAYKTSPLGGSASEAARGRARAKKTR